MWKLAFDHVQMMLQDVLESWWLEICMDLICWLEKTQGFPFRFRFFQCLIVVCRHCRLTELLRIQQRVLSRVDEPLVKF